MVLKINDDINVLNTYNQNEVAKLQSVADPATIPGTEEKKKANVLLGKKKSQLELLAGCIKTKRKRSDYGAFCFYMHAVPKMQYTARNYHLFKVVENRMQQCCAAHIVHSCQQYCSALLHLIAG